MSTLDVDSGVLDSVKLYITKHFFWYQRVLKGNFVMNKHLNAKTMVLLGRQLSCKYFETLRAQYGIFFTSVPSHTLTLYLHPLSSYPSRSVTILTPVKAHQTNCNAVLSQFAAFPLSGVWVILQAPLSVIWSAENRIEFLLSDEPIERKGTSIYFVRLPWYFF